MTYQITNKKGELMENTEKTNPPIIKTENTATKFQPFRDDGETNKIYKIISELFADELTEALLPNGNTKKIVDILQNRKEFESCTTYKNPQRAREIATDIAGLGVIETLIKKYNDKNIQDIGYNSNHILTIDTAENKFVYTEKNFDPHINTNYMLGLINRLAQHEAPAGKQFVADSPIYNGSAHIGDGDDRIYLRISATHTSLAPTGPTLSIRVSKSHLALTKANFNNIAPMMIYNLLHVFIAAHASIVISAETGAGKTELQKLLLGFVPFDERIVLIEDTNEMHLTTLYPKKDIFSWVSDPSLTINHKPVNTTTLIEQSLRTNPKWLIVAESRGDEAYELISGARSGHPIITTLHATSNAAVPGRLIGMSAMGYKFNEEMLDRDILNYINIGIHLSLKANYHGRKLRYIDQIVEYVPRSEKYPDGINVLFQQHIDKDGYRTYWMNDATDKLKDHIYRELDEKLQYPTIPKDSPKKEKVFEFKSETGE